MKFPPNPCAEYLIDNFSPVPGLIETLDAAHIRTNPVFKMFVSILSGKCKDIIPIAFRA
jgi:hypothetical protein